MINLSIVTRMVMIVIILVDVMTILVSTMTRMVMILIILVDIECH